MPLTRWPSNGHDEETVQVSLQLHRPDGKGGLERVPPRLGDWREGLRSPRWRPAALRNTEMNPTPTLVSIVFWVGLAAVTFVLLVAGYGTHFWH